MPGMTPSTLRIGYRYRPQRLAEKYDICLVLVTEIESNFGVEFTMTEVQAALSIGKFRQLIEAHAA